MAAEGSELAIEVRDVYKQYGRGRNAVKVLKGIDVDVPYHSIYALLGASGCGKTTLLRCCLGFIRPNKGKITVMGNPPGCRGTSIPGKDLGYMPQDIGLVNELSILETMYFFGIMFRMGFRQIRERAQFLGNLLELPPLNKRIKEMSGGEQRRVSFAVSLIQQPPLLIMDEPTVGMDSLLRQSVWQYIGELTVAKECTVVITTHYIDEARRANRVALMRSGKLMTQSKPDDLIRAHNAVTLEEVFVKLAYKQEQDEDKLATNVVDEEIDTKQSIQYTEDTGAEQHKMKELNFVDRYFPRYLWGIDLAIILAITAKTTTKTLRSIVGFIMVLFLPVITVLGVVYFVGGDIKDVKVFYHNYDNTSLVNTFIDNVRAADEFDLEQVGGFEVRDDVSDGEGPVGFIINDIFTESLYTRYYQVCEAHFHYPDIEFPPSYVINNSTIDLYVDATDTQLLTQSLLRLNAEGEKFLNSFFLENFQARYVDLFEFPVQLKEEVFGSISWEYRDYIGSAILTAILFYNAIAMTAMNFILERKEGLFERSYAAGASVADFLLAYTVHGSVILLIIVVLLMVTVFAILGIERTGSLFLYALIVWLTGMIGFSFGLWLSSRVTDEISVQNATQLLGGPITFFSGGMWPVYGQPAVVRAISAFLPVTQPTTAASAIGSKGLGLGDEPVYLGFIAAVAWLLIIYLVSIAFFRTE